MSALAGLDAAPRAHSRDGARGATASAEGVAPATLHAESPTTSVWRMLLAVAIALLLGLVLNARPIVRDSAEMQDGLVRSVILAIGQPALRIAEATHLTWPRDRLDAALGHAPQPAVPPLLAAIPLGPPSSPTSVSSPTATATGVRGIARPTTRIMAMVRSTPAFTATRSPVAADPTPRRTATATSQRVAAIPTPSSSATPNPTATRPVHPAGGVQSSRRPSPEQATRPSAPAHVTPTATASATARPTAPRTQSPTRHPASVGTSQHVKPPVATKPHRKTAPPHLLRRPAIGHPLRLLVTGDSLTGYLGPELLDKAAAIAPIAGFVDTHNGTGLTRPDYVDWSLVAQQQVAADNPDAVVVMMGGNDFQNMTLPNGQFFTAGTPAWTREYARRAAICMRIWTQGGTRRVYWLSMPPARDPTWAADDAQINIALRQAAAQVPGAEYLNILGPVTLHGKYADFVPDGHGQQLLVREPDGVHLNSAGSAIVAGEVLQVLRREWGGS